MFDIFLGTPPNRPLDIYFTFWTYSGNMALQQASPITAVRADYCSQYSCRTEGSKEGRTEGRKEVRKEVRKQGRKEGRKEGKT